MSFLLLYRKKKKEKKETTAKKEKEGKQVLINVTRERGQQKQQPIAAVLAYITRKSMRERPCLNLYERFSVCVS